MGVDSGDNWLMVVHGGDNFKSGGGRDKSSAANSKNEWVMGVDSGEKPKATDRRCEW